ncbi:hypothetical protein MTR62_01080 [Novosphingobium sp. 1949]|uniref:Nuclease n=1 Tax=Novosphingobium organovorum TaxID=2930092 RepID=A0ABT0B8E1_9SPHN|nr:hypothetical protein [Novosphingobium organovorum]MCJ2181307.1 hypothetical protein [Novosphingobium organovorum]
MLAILAALLLAPSPVTAVADDLDIAGQVAKGKVLCTNPDVASRTCTTIDRQAPAGPGRFTDTGEVLIPAAKAITLETRSAMTLEGANQLCGQIRREDLLQGTLRVEGVALEPEPNAAALAHLAQTIFAQLDGRRVCETLGHDKAGRLVKIDTMEGFDGNVPPRPVQWIAPDAGYTVAPHDR